MRYMFIIVKNVLFLSSIIEIRVSSFKMMGIIMYMTLYMYTQKVI